MAAKNEVLGTTTCPLCKSEYAQEVRQSGKSGKPYINCDECGAQIFARQPASVKIMRELAKPIVENPTPAKVVEVAAPGREQDTVKLAKAAAEVLQRKPSTLLG